MRPTGNRVLVAVNMEQKNNYEIELSSGLKLWMDSDFGTDNRIAKPVVARVVGGSKFMRDLKFGDLVLCHHNSFSRTTGNTIFGDTGVKTENGESIFSLETSMIYVRIDAKGDSYPLPDFLICERIKEVIETNLIIPDSAQKNYADRFKVLTVSDNNSEEYKGLFKAGDIVVCHPKSDYEIVYTLNKKPMRLIRVRCSDVLGFLNQKKRA